MYILTKTKKKGVLIDRKSLKKLFVAFASLGLLLTGSGPVGPTVVAVTGISTTEEVITIEVGESHDLVYTVAPEDATNKSVTAAVEGSAVTVEGTTIVGAEAGEATVTVTTVDGGFTVTYTVTVKEQGVVFSFADRVAEYEAKGYTGVVIPDYICESSEATLTQPYPTEYPTYWLIKGSSSEEMAAFVSSFSETWEDVVDSYGDHYLYLGSPEPGESCPCIYVGDYTAESLAGILLSFDEYTEPAVVASFPLEEVNAYLTENSAYYGFTFSQAEADAISALTTSFVFQSGTDSYGYPIAYVIMDGSIVSEVLAVIDSTITAAGFAYDEDYEAYINSMYCFIYAVVEESSTYLVLN